MPANRIAQTDDAHLRHVLAGGSEVNDRPGAGYCVAMWETRRRLLDADREHALGLVRQDLVDDGLGIAELALAGRSGCGSRRRSRSSTSACATPVAR